MFAQVKPEELKEIVGAYKDTGDPKKIQKDGIHVAGERFVVIKADERSIYGKKVLTLPTAKSSLHFKRLKAFPIQRMRRLT